MLQGWNQQAGDDGELAGTGEGAPLTGASSSGSSLPFGIFHAVQVWPDGSYDTEEDLASRNLPSDSAEGAAHQAPQELLCEQEGRQRSRSRSPSRTGVEVEEAEESALMTTSLELLIGGLGLVRSVDDDRRADQLPWWYADILQQGLRLVRRGGDPLAIVQALRNGLQQCGDVAFVHHVWRWVEEMVDDLRDEGVLGWTPQPGTTRPDESEVGDWACNAMKILNFEYQRQGQAGSAGSREPARRWTERTSRSRSPKRSSGVPAERGEEDTDRGGDATSFMETNHDGGRREDRRSSRL